MSRQLRDRADYFIKKITYCLERQYTVCYLLFHYILLRFIIDEFIETRVASDVYFDYAQFSVLTSITCQINLSRA